MEESILISIKELLGVSENDDSFDTDIIIHINSVFMFLKRMGVGPTNGFRITGPGDIWSDFIENDCEDFECVKTYVYLKTRLVFDPPASSTTLQTMKELINELEWSLNIVAES